MTNFKLLTALAVTTMLAAPAAMAEEVRLSLLPELVPYEGATPTNSEGVPIFRL